MRIKFHGFLKRLCPKEYYEVEAKTAAEAIRGLTNQLKQLRRIGENRWSCRVKECPNAEDLYKINESLFELNLYPDYTLAGAGGDSKKMGLKTIIIGALIIVATFVLAWCTGGLALATLGLFGGAVEAGVATTVVTSAYMMGAAMILGGIAMMFQKTPKNKTDDSEKNKYFGSNHNTTEIGTRIAIGYGKYKVAGQILSIQQEAY